MRKLAIVEVNEKKTGKQFFVDEIFKIRGNLFCKICEILFSLLATNY